MRQGILRFPHGPDCRPLLACLPKLRRLRIWLDHDKPYFWSLVNERTSLSLLKPHRENPELEISFNLPKLNPTLESALRHLTEGISSPRGTITVTRRRRQETRRVLGEDLEFYLSWSGRRDGRTLEYFSKCHWRGLVLRSEE
ncbi:hypothetical protein BCR34DRAFT_571757 [Clohesyomyces aquaticus]|uniref:Uncharacterized protein n=1 Tax=Clohesyomyces aquaticus TaxID=1231657 RepID=A0A1Y1Z6D9_9PLEO|nr:hypothetical protein BCR34DRAFT_571757 [Clohesyomyces aquaticus]